MTIRMERFVWEVVGCHHGAAYEGLQWERRKHVEAEAARAEVSKGEAAKSKPRPELTIEQYSP